MNYNELQSGQFFECTIKSTYAEIYVYSPKDNKYYFVFSLQKKDYNGVLGCGEKINPNGNNLVPITLTDKAIIAILKKVGLENIGALQSNLNLSNNSTTQLHRVDNSIKVDNNLFADSDLDSDIIIPKPNSNPNNYPDNYTPIHTPTSKPNINPGSNLNQDATVNKHLSKIDDGVVYVNYKAIDCVELKDEDVEVEEIVEDTNKEEKKDFSKLIWIALAAAAALFK